MALCKNCLKCTHNEPLIDGVCKDCYEARHEDDELNCPYFDSGECDGEDCIGCDPLNEDWDGA